MTTAGNEPADGIAARRSRKAPGGAKVRAPGKRSGSRAVDKPLTPKEVAFVEAYVGGMPAGRAYTAAGYLATGDAAYVGAAKLMGRERVVRAIEAARVGALQRADIAADRVVRGLSSIAFGDVRRLFDASGRLKPVADLADGEAAVVASLEVVQTADADEGDGDADGERGGPAVTTKIRVADKLRALELLGKHLGLFDEKHRVTVGGGPASPIHHAHEHVHRGDAGGSPTVNVFARVDELLMGYVKSFATGANGAGANAGGSGAVQVDDGAGTAIATTTTNRAGG